MSVTKADIVQSLTEQIGFTKNKSIEITETVIESSNEPLRLERMSLSAALESSQLSKRLKEEAGNLRDAGQCTPVATFNL